MSKKRNLGIIYFHEIKKYKRRGPFTPLAAGERTFPAALKPLRRKLTLYLKKTAERFFLADLSTPEKAYFSFDNIHDD